MNKLLLLALTIAAATALPSQVVSQGPWVTEEDWSRDPKGIGESIPSPTSLLGRLGNWWTWDRSDFV